MMMMQKAKGRKTIGDILFRDLVATFAFKAGVTVLTAPHFFSISPTDDDEDQDPRGQISFLASYIHTLHFQCLHCVETSYGVWTVLHFSSVDSRLNCTVPTPTLVNVQSKRKESSGVMRAPWGIGGYRQGEGVRWELPWYFDLEHCLALAMCNCVM